MSARLAIRLFAAIVMAAIVAPAVANAAPVMEGDNQAACLAGEDLTPWLHEQGATWMRIGLDTTNITSVGAAACIRAAHDAGFKVYLDLIYNLANTPAQDAAWVQTYLPRFAPYVDAVSLGNEGWDELGHRLGPGLYTICTTTTGHATVITSPAKTVVTTRRVRVHVRFRATVVKHVVRLRHGRHVHVRIARRVWKWRWAYRSQTTKNVVPAGHADHPTSTQSCRPSTDSEDYDANWNAMEPVVAKLAPDATRVYMDAGPWSSAVANIEAGLTATGQFAPAGVQAVAFHPYDFIDPDSGLNAVPRLAAWLQAHGLPLWLSEMAPCQDPAHVSYVHLEDRATFNARVAAVVAISPNVAMISENVWPVYENGA